MAQLIDIGPIPPGDPAAMRQYAAALNGDAARVRAFADQITGKSQGMPFTAPFAERARAAIQDDCARFRTIAQGLDDLAASLLSAAGTVETDQAAWRRQRDLAQAANQAAATKAAA